VHSAAKTRSGKKGRGIIMESSVKKLISGGGGAGQGSFNTFRRGEKALRKEKSGGNGIVKGQISSFWWLSMGGRDYFYQMKKGGVGEIRGGRFVPV